jgi:rubrerythrin
MNFNSVEEVIEFAIEKEQEAVDFYNECAQQEVFSGSKKTLEEMAAEEQKHKDLLQKLGKEEIVISDYKFKWISDMKRSDYLVEMKYEKGMDYPDLLRLAMKREETALKLYNEMLGNSDRDDFKKVFKMLCQEEAKHKLFLETLYDDYMAVQGD